MISKKEKIGLYLALIVGCLGLLSTMKLLDVVTKDYRLYKQESACVADYIKKNYSRNEIITGNGTCWIRGTEQ